MMPRAARVRPPREQPPPHFDACDSAVAFAADIDLPFPDIEPWADGNTGIPYLWSFDSGVPGPHALVQALTHGNEVCGALALDWALRRRLRPQRGRLSLCFANVEAYAGFDPLHPWASRFVDRDFNRVWAREVLDGPEDCVELRRARELAPWVDTVDILLDLHSMAEHAPPMALAGRHPKGEALARGIGIPVHIVRDAGHAGGCRLRDYAFFDHAEDPRTALLVECGQHWERSSAIVARQVMLRFLEHLDMLAAPAREADPAALQRVVEVTHTITTASEDFRFVMPVSALAVVPRRDTLLALDDRSIRTPYDDCVLVMPSCSPRVGDTAVRLGRFVS